MSARVVHYSPLPERRPRVGCSRVKTGCLCCRIRRKKCDEQKPVCGGCGRNVLICSWPRQENSGSKSPELRWRDRLLSGKTPCQDNTEDLVSLPTAVSRDTSSPDEKSSSYSSSSSPRRENNHIQKISSENKVVGTCSLPGLVKRSLILPGTAIINLQQVSPIFFEHYLTETSRLISARLDPENPFVTCVLPQAYADTLVMQSVLALSGAHLYHRTMSAEMKSAAWTHYALALRELKHKMTQAAAGEEIDVLNVLLTMLLLCHVEAVSGESHGAIFHHLRASRHLVLSALGDSVPEGREDLHGFLLEVYAYLVMVANITIASECGERTLAFDPFLSSLQHLHQYRTFGVMLGCAHGLFEMIPLICQLGYQRIQENEEPSSSTTKILYTSLDSKIRAWTPPEDIEGDEQWRSQLITAARVYQLSILIFLETSFYGANVNDQKLRIKVQSLVDETIPFFSALKSVEPQSPLLATMLWPLLMIGSCICLPDQQAWLRELLVKTSFHMAIVDRALQLLEWLWEAPDDVSYGPVGLERVMRAHKINFCMG